MLYVHNFFISIFFSQQTIPIIFGIPEMHLHKIASIFVFSEECMYTWADNKHLILLMICFIRILSIQFFSLLIWHISQLLLLSLSNLSLKKNAIRMLCMKVKALFSVAVLKKKLEKRPKKFFEILPQTYDQGQTLAEFGIGDFLDNSKEYNSI